ncbi:hypothetical protein DFJ73DRAFT_824678 [Zopfochytrium polystomum]|nr:hypothetical protein DFJ73DRAFT_824678 [Zopfochytrium polystomum]
MPLRTVSLDAADPAVGHEVSKALQTEIRFQCMYCHTPKKVDELELRYGDVVVLRKFYHDGWAYGINFSLQTSGVFPIFYVEEATELPTPSTSRFSHLAARYTVYNAGESEPLH